MILKDYVREDDHARDVVSFPDDCTHHCDLTCQPNNTPSHVSQMAERASNKSVVLPEREKLIRVGVMELLKEDGCTPPPPAPLLSL